MTSTILNSNVSLDTQSTRLLLVDDDASFRKLTARNFGRRGYEVQESGCGSDALGMIEKHDFEVVILDVSMPDMTGIEVLRHLDESNGDIEVIMLTGQTTVRTAVEAMKLGAIDYLVKPIEMDELIVVVEKAVKSGRLKREHRHLKAILQRSTPSFDMIGQSEAMHEVFRLIQRAGPTNKPILIQGESGTGKERVARALHQASLVADKPMVVINCAALSEHLLESELFGHEKGSFTGATAAKEGLFELADGGTLFIDEIGEMAGSLQAKMLRVLEDGSLRRVGSVKERKVNVRIISATNRDMQKEVDEGRFREDLFYRIDVMTLRVPPLRARADDIPNLIHHFAGEDWGITVQTLDAMKKYHWPGNVRQLINAIERAKILADDHTIHLKNLPPTISEAVSPSATQELATQELALQELALPNREGLVHQTETKPIHRDRLVTVLQQCEGNKARAARSLGISRRTLYRLLKKHGIAVDKTANRTTDHP
ncbi:Transcriptional regulatory protein ZraR [Novipirellula aureliae]|uniref:Transcriptional regulatory protein ZraR n=1 Tax=Novipirellula aureliae TaxID=2527966 RepID=A0A5C6EEP4_9BACT|nr:sigma-54 dependent transcriptional regulator [Novipirellula aureliae]TWU46026.1 Transcriptional regulatory protein ZraR [Novipirellula aureliae]